MTAMDTDTLILALVFASVLLLVHGSWWLVSNRRGGSERRRLAARLQPETVEGTTTPALLHRRDTARPRDRLAPLARLLGLAGLRLPVERALTAVGGATAALFPLLALVTGLPLGAALVLALALAAGLPLLVVAAMARRRVRAFESQLPGALDTMVRSLRAGHPLTAAIGMVAREVPAPVGAEFAIVFDEMTYGLDLREALGHLMRRMPVAAVNFLVVAVRIQAGIGGNLAEVLASLARVMRERDKLGRKVKALSAEARLSAAILSVLPFAVAGIVATTNPDYYGTVAEDPLFVPLIGAGLGGIVTGILVMARMVHLKP